jgi:hypothetical protein
MRRKIGSALNQRVQVQFVPETEGYSRLQEGEIHHFLLNITTTKLTRNVAYPFNSLPSGDVSLA